MKKRKWKIFIGICLVTCILMENLFGCTANNSEEEKLPLANVEPLPDADDPVTFRIFVRDSGTEPAKDNPVLQRITELTGVTIEFEFLVGSLDQKINIMTASEDYPDAIFAEPGKLMDAGALIPLENYLPDYPFLYEQYADYQEKMAAADGHIYILDLYSVWKNPSPIMDDPEAGFYIQKAVLEEAGYVIPHTLDEYFELIDEYRMKHPEIDGNPTIGFEILCDGWKDFGLRNPPQHLLGGGNDGDVYVDLNTMTASYYQTSDTAKTYYRKLNEEHAKGTILAESLTQSYDQYISKISSGSVLGFFDQIWNFQQAEDVLKSEGRYERTYVSVPITNEGVKDSYISTREKHVTGNNGIGITTSCKDPERLLAFMDWLLQPEVQNYLQWGMEGEDYQILDNGGKVYTEEGRRKYLSQELRRDKTGYVLWYYMPKRQGLYDDGTPCGPEDSSDEFKASLSAYDRKFLEAYGFDYPSQFLSDPVKRPAYYPVWAMAFEEGSPAVSAQSRLTLLCDQYNAQLILCKPEEFDTLWEEFVKEFENADLEPFLDAVNERIRVLSEMEKK